VFPIVQVRGSAYERGRQYGEQARERVHRSIAAYERTYRYFAGWDWQRARSEAMRFLPAIEDFSPMCAAELAGIADGAGVDRADVMAVNVRTEVMYSARVREAAAAASLRLPEECSAFARVSPDAHVVVGQNWDWAPFASDTVVVVQSEPDDAPAFVTVVEAGLLAKFGVNAAGFALMTNALACTEDVGEPGVPYHVMLRSLLGCHDTPEALALLESTTRSSSANYLLVDESGDAVDVEARPGGSLALHSLRPDEHGVLLHTNHFVSRDFAALDAVVDYADLIESTSQFRLERVTSAVAAASNPGDLDMYAVALTDHTNHPDSVCRHPDAVLPDEEQSITVTSVLVDLDTRRILLSEGPPCERGYQELDVPLLAVRTA
jgi:isopenicillin-N N-acyltransferase like protein